MFVIFLMFVIFVMFVMFVIFVISVIFVMFVMLMMFVMFVHVLDSVRFFALLRQALHYNVDVTLVQLVYLLNERA